MSLTATLEKLVRSHDLEPKEAADAMLALIDEAPPPELKAGVLIALRMKGVTSGELAAFVKVLREKAMRLPDPPKDLIDTCGTGGGEATFNISTSAALVAAAAGVRIAKHGNRAVTSTCGSADVLEALGVHLQNDPAKLQKVLEEVGIVFLFAQHHHPGFRHIGPVRKALGVRTVFNQLGPLLNPAGATRQLIGVYDFSLARAMAEALLILGADRALVVHGDDDLDEISPCTRTRYVELRGGELREGEWQPEDFGIEPISFRQIRPAETLEGNAALLREAIGQAASPRAQAILPSAGAAIYLAGLADSLRDGAAIAADTVASGHALQKLDQLIEATRP